MKNFILKYNTHFKTTLKYIFTRMGSSDLYQRPLVPDKLPVTLNQ